MRTRCRELVQRRSGHLFNLCGHGHFDLAAFEQYLPGTLVDREHLEEEIERPVARI
jgi:tryptophan synthase beta chain